MRKETKTLLPDWQKKIEWRTVQSTQSMVKLFQECLFTIYPSLMEGYGIPVAESLLCGRAVICGSHSALPEVGGKGALYTEINHPEKFGEAILALLEDEALRDRLAKAGRTHLEKNNPMKSSDKLAALYRSLL